MQRLVGRALHNNNQSLNLASIDIMHNGSMAVLIPYALDSRESVLVDNISDIWRTLAIAPSKTRDDTELTESGTRGISTMEWVVLEEAQGPIATSRPEKLHSPLGSCEATGLDARWTAKALPSQLRSLGYQKPQSLHHKYTVPVDLVSSLADRTQCPHTTLDRLCW